MWGRENYVERVEDMAVKIRIKMDLLVEEKWSKVLDEKNCMKPWTHLDEFFGNEADVRVSEKKSFVMEVEKTVQGISSYTKAFKEFYKQYLGGVEFEDDLLYIMQDNEIDMSRHTTLIVSEEFWNTLTVTFYN
jgi:hypothetical protein